MVLIILGILQTINMMGLETTLKILFLQLYMTERKCF